MSGELQVLSDSGGSMIIGAIAPDVYFIRIVDFISASLGTRVAAQLHQELADTTQVHLFFDVEGAQGTELMARGAIMRALLAQRKRLLSVTILAREGELQARVTDWARMLTNNVLVLQSQAVFNARIREAAPGARAKFPASGRIRIASPPLGRARSLRPARRSLRPRGRSGTDD
jgi:hypothetical protein